MIGTVLRLIDHPDQYRDGTRVLMLKSRHKDGHDKERQIMRVTHSRDHFNCTLDELLAEARDGERIYGAAGVRDMAKAVRLFKQRQLDADYDDDPLRFYRSVNERWISALMAPTSQATKLWLFDCDTAEDGARVLSELAEHYDREMEPYQYASKSGLHVVVQPFDRSRLSDGVRSLIHENPSILWGY